MSKPEAIEKNELDIEVQKENKAPMQLEQPFGMRPSSASQIKPRATGSRYRDYEIFMCVPSFTRIPTPDGKQRTIISSVKVSDKIRDCKIEPHLVYGSKQWNTVGYNDNFILEAGLPIQLYFPKGTAATGDNFKATTIEIFINNPKGGKDVISKRKFNFFEYKGSSLKEMVEKCKKEYEYVFETFE